MVMAKSSEKKSTFVKPSGFLKKHWWKVGISLLFLFGLVSFGYEKYLDRQNVSDMKQLLADFEKLKTDVEAETGEELYIEASCGSVGKFATSYACSVYLRPLTGVSSAGLLRSFTALSVISNARCNLASVDYKIKDSSKDYYICSGLHVRGASSAEIEKLFYKYDTSPGSAI
jgi:hypothetical protein